MPLEVTHNNLCHNCGHKLSAEASFCDQCGQARIEARLNFWKLLKDFVNNIFNLDGRLFRSLRHMWRPAFLAKEYVNGKRKSYVNPIRFFLLMLVLLFFLLKNSLNSELFDQGTMKAIQKVEQKELAEIYDTTICNYFPDIDIEAQQKFRSELFNEAEKKSPRIFVGGTFLGYNLKEYDVTRDDAYSMDIDSLFNKYQLTNWYDQLFIRQLIKIDKDRSGSASYFISKLIWGVILYIFLLAGLMKILYIRNNFYYLEHLIVIILYTAKALLVINIILLIQLGSFEIPLWNYIVLAIYGSILLYFFFTLKKYYEQGFIKTFIKSSIIGFSCFYILLISVMFVSIISLALL